MLLRGGCPLCQSQTVNESTNSELTGVQPADDTVRGAVLITGGGSGIGLATARRLVASGRRVVICGRTESRLTAAAGELESLCRGDAQVRWVAADVTEAEQINAAGVVAAELGGEWGITGCFANAGGAFHIGDIATADPAAVRATIDLNLTGTILTLQAVLPHMKRGGSIVVMSSGAGHFPHRGLWAYGAAKAGIDMLCRYAADELGAQGIRVNSIQPGLIDDDLTSMITTGGPLLDDYLAETPLGRIGQVDDVARLVEFLLGENSGWVSGASIPIDGAHHVRRGANYMLLFGSA